ncbi:MAG: hypothetical protein JNM62_16740 [Flavobacteriales bacterium]|nr:hypothetical protein [Flavobacteriales bacterium]
MKLDHLVHITTVVINLIHLNASGQGMALEAPYRTQSSSLYTALSTSYSTSTNWQGQDLRNFSFLGNVLYKHNTQDSTRSHAHQVLADLGYLKFVDSLWIKGVDRFQVNLLWATKARRFDHSYSLLLSTQFLPNTSWSYDPELQRTTRTSVGGLFRPFTLEAGYGAVLRFWNTSSINFAFATLKLSGYPKELTAPQFSDATLLQSRAMNYYMSYGLGLITAINKPIGQRLQWINNSRAFCNGFDKDHANFDISNMLIVKLWKYIQFRFDTRVAYNPRLNYQVQFRQEALIGFFYERNS